LPLTLRTLEKFLFNTFGNTCAAALNCGAKSCPPIKSFSVEAVLDELDVAAMAFFEDPANCSVNVAQNKVTLTSIVKWYFSDFGATNEQVCKTIASWLVGEKAESMQKVIKSGNLSIGYSAYDWSTDSKASKSYRRHSSVAGIVMNLCSVV
jgi:hypothetical protein